MNNSSFVTAGGVVFGNKALKHLWLAGICGILAALLQYRFHACWFVSCVSHAGDDQISKIFVP